MTDQAIYLLIGLFFVIFIFSRLRRSRTGGGKYVIDDKASSLLGFTGVGPEDRSPEDLQLEEEFGGRLFARGHFQDNPAALLYFYDSGRRRGGRSGMSSRRVTLALSLPKPAPVSMLIEPKLPLLLRRAAPKEPQVTTGDADFDERFNVYSEDGARVLSYLNRPLRSLLVALRREISPDLPDDGGGWKAAASGIKMGKLRLLGTSLAFTINGSPDEETARHLQSAAVVLSRFATAAENG